MGSSTSFPESSLSFQGRGRRETLGMSVVEASAKRGKCRCVFERCWIMFGPRFKQI